MKKFGFTLAEVMVALALIGVITSLTIPTFVASNKNRAHAAKLSTTLSAIENAFSSMMAAETAQDIRETRFGRAVNQNERSEALSRHLKLIGSNDFETYYGNDFTYNTITPDGDNPDISDFEYFEMKNGALIGYCPYLVNDHPLTGGSLGFLTIDVNGTNSPNVWARDVFLFALGLDGGLYPAGGTIFNDLYQSDGIEYSCTPENRGVGCTAELIENNYEINF